MIQTILESQFKNSHLNIISNKSLSCFDDLISVIAQNTHSRKYKNSNEIIIMMEFKLIV